MKTKTVLFSLLLICSSLTLFAQTNWVWTQNIPTAHGGTNGTGAVATDASGNVYVTGYFYSDSITIGSITLVNISPNYADLFLAKYDAQGNVLWAQRAGGTGDDRGLSLSTDAAGNVFLSGLFGSPTLTFGSIILANAVSGISHDMFIVKFDPNGNVLWAQRAGGSNYDEGYSVSTDLAGNVLLTGSFRSTSITFGSVTLFNTSAGFHDVYITKYDTNGNVLWAKKAGGNDNDYGNSVSTDASGNVFLTGYLQSSSITFGATTLVNAFPGYSDVFIAKYDPNGNALWAKSTGGINNDAGTSVSTDPAGNAFITGYFISSSITFGSTVLPNPSGFATFLVKYDPAGNVLWATGSTGNNGSQGTSVSTDLSGNVFLCGAFLDSAITFGTTTLTAFNPNTYATFVLQYDGTGNLLCADAIANQGNLGAAYACTDDFGHVYVACDYEANPLIVGNDNFMLTGSDDLFLSKYECSLASMDELNDPESISIYPNPSSGILTVDPKITAGEISIYNLFGELIYSSSINNPAPGIDLSGEANGIYFATIKTGQKTFTQKIILQK